MFHMTPKSQEILVFVSKKMSNEVMMSQGLTVLITQAINRIIMVIYCFNAIMQVFVGTWLETNKMSRDLGSLF